MEVYCGREQAEQAEELYGTLAETLATPGINVFTREMKVTPGFSYNLSGALVYQSCGNFKGELGYNPDANFLDFCEKLTIEVNIREEKDRLKWKLLEQERIEKERIEKERLRKDRFEQKSERRENISPVEFDRLRMMKRLEQKAAAQQ